MPETYQKPRKEIDPAIAHALDELERTDDLDEFNQGVIIVLQQLAEQIMEIKKEMRQHKNPRGSD